MYKKVDKKRIIGKRGPRRWHKGSLTPQKNNFKAGTGFFSRVFFYDNKR
jgi:hypothetical protein